MSSIALKVNGRSHTLDVDPDTPLLYILSDDLELNGPKFGCGLGQCGACTVIVGDRAGTVVRDAGRQASRAEITTLEGLGTRRSSASDSAGVHRRAGGAVRLLPERRDHDREGVTSISIRHPDDQQIQGAMSGVLCRCFTHTRMLRAIRRYARGGGAA